MKATAREATLLCQKELVEAGFVKTTTGAAREISSGAFLWVGLNAGTHSGFVRINPFIGLHVAPIMKLVADLEGSKYSKLKLATVSVHLGELVPEVEQFTFDGEHDRQQASRLVSVIEQYGLPWALASLENIAELLEARVPQLGGYPQKYAAALLLEGQVAAASKFVEGHLSFVSKWKSALDSFAPFVEGFRARYN